jgi:hypothetical protein
LELDAREHDESMKGTWIFDHQGRKASGKAGSIKPIAKATAARSKLISTRMSST